MKTHAPEPTAPVSTPPTVQRRVWAIWLVASLLLVTSLGTLGYASVSVYMATQIVHQDRVPLSATENPMSYGLRYQLVSFPSREDRLPLHGWFIPGVLSDGRLTTDRTIVVVHGKDAGPCLKTWKPPTLAASITYRE